LFWFGFVIEGDGEVEAIGVLIRRICQELFNNFSIEMSRPVRITKSRLLRVGELERAIRLASLKTGSRGPVLVILDADDDCPALLGPSLKARAHDVIERHRVSIVIPKFEFENWFLAAASSLSGKRGLRHDLSAPPDPENIRGAKEWLDRNMVAGRSYSPTIDQAALAAIMDIHSAMNCRSFERLCREIGRLIDG